MRTTIILIVLLAASATGNAATIRVPGDYTAIQQAINVATHGDTVLVAPGTYFENLYIYPVNVTVRSEFGPQMTVIDGSQASRVVYIYGDEYSTPVLEGFTIRNGFSNSYGAGIYCDMESQPFIRGNVITDNRSNYRGGGIYCYYSSTFIIDNMIIGNSAAQGGGGIYSRFSGPVLLNNLIAKNSSEDGTGGGMFNDKNSIAELVNNTFSHNEAKFGGGGIYCGEYSSMTVVNSIFFKNCLPANYEISVGFASNFTISYSDVYGGLSEVHVEPGGDLYWNSGMINQDPKFWSAEHDYYYLKQDPCQPGCSNPCVDAGDPAYAMITGATRVDGVQDAGVVDMGYHYGLATTRMVPGDFKTIQDTIDASLNGDTVLVSPGTYLENLDFKGKAITVRSSAGPDQTVVDGRQWGSVVRFMTQETPFSVIEGFTLTNGSGTKTGYRYGGAIICLDSSPTIRDNVIANSNAYAGGGIYCEGEGSSPLITRNVIRNNSAEYGGGIACGYGGLGPKIECNMVVGNTATGSGGGYGGGIYFCEDCHPLFYNNTLFNNSADVAGGGLCCVEKCSAKILNSVFWSNKAPVGQEIAVQHHSVPVELSIYYSDVDGGLDSVFVDPGSTLNWGSFMIDQDPKFVKPSKGDCHLSWISPCINRGDATGAPSHDLDGDLVNYMGGVDMGADEFTGHHPLEATGFTISASGGADIDIFIDAGPGNAGQGYAVLGSTIGTSPGTPLPFGLVLPLNWDGWTDFVINYWNSQFFVNFLGKLDATGKAQAKLWVPGLHPVWIGQTMYYACTLYNPFDFVTNPVAIRVEK